MIVMNYRIIGKSHVVFLPQHSTITCLHRVIDDFHESLNNKEFVGSCFLDISKCFDCVDHDLILFKLEKYGIYDKELKWFSNYITGRKQLVCSKGKNSAIKELLVGVPQGSVLAPVLFLLFINDISECLNNAVCSIYADDVVIYVTGDNIHDVTLNLQNTVNVLNSWYKRNRLKINISKTKTMLISTKSSECLNIYIDHELIEQVHSIRYLGIIIDENLKWNDYLRQLCKSVAYKIYCLGKLGKFLNMTLLNTICKSTIQPCLDYGVSVWGNYPNKLKLPLLRLQKRAARHVTSNYDYTNISGLDLMKNLSWQTIEDRRDYFLSTLMYQCVHGLAPSRLCNEIEMYFDGHGLNTRNANSLNVVPPKPNIQLYCQSLKYSGAKVWNLLPNNLQNAQSLDVFKLLYKKSKSNPL